jgi:putative hydrolase of the HAD superfamily
MFPGEPLKPTDPARRPVNLPRLPASVRVVFFDAVGTLITPEPSAAGAYHDLGRRFGSRREPGEVRQAFGRAFARQEEQDATGEFRTDEAREVERWRNIVAEVLPDVADFESCFRALYEHFARPSAWRCDPEAGEVLRELQGRGYLVGVASNFDHRLRSVVAGLPDLTPVRHFVISSEVGWKKPARRFFEALATVSGYVPQQILLVGDDPDNDFRGATEAGLHALLLDPEGTSSLPAEARLTSLRGMLADCNPICSTENS